MAIKGLGAALADKMDKEKGGEPSESGSSRGKLAACEDIISAIKSGDAKALKAAMDDYSAMGSIPEADEDQEDDLDY